MDGTAVFTVTYHRSPYTARELDHEHLRHDAVAASARAGPARAASGARAGVRRSWWAEALRHGAVGDRRHARADGDTRSGTVRAGARDRRAAHWSRAHSRPAHSARGIRDRGRHARRDRDVSLQARLLRAEWN